MRELLYDRQAAVAYARKWVLGRNPAYYDFENIGGDCTNYASQCIFAGAGVMNFTPVMGWYYRSAYDRAAAWSGVKYLYDFLVTNRGAGPYARVVTASAVRPGDIVQRGTDSGEFYHSPVVTAVYPAILVAAHTYDVLDRPLSSYRYEAVRFLHIKGVGRDAGGGA